jgi:hypothetical protein
MDRRGFLGAAPLAGFLAGKAGGLDPMIAPPILGLIGSSTWFTPWGSTGTSANGRSNTFKIDKNSFTRVQIWSSSGANAVVTIDERSQVGGPAPWFTVATLANPVTTTGEYWSVPIAMELSVNVSSYISGTIFAVFESHT